MEDILPSRERPVIPFDCTGLIECVLRNLFCSPPADGQGFAPHFSRTQTMQRPASLGSWVIYCLRINGAPALFLDTPMPVSAGVLTDKKGYPPSLPRLILQSVVACINTRSTCQVQVAQTQPRREKNPFV